MNTDDFIDFISNLDPCDAPPAIVAKLYEHLGSITKFAGAVNARAVELAKASELPGYGMKPGRTCALAWAADGVYPEPWYEKKLLSPTQVVKQNLATEKYLTDACLALRPPADPVPVKLEGREGNELF